MAKIYQNFDDVGVAGNVLYIKTIPYPANENPYIYPNGDSVIMTKVNTENYRGYEYVLFHDEEGTRPVYNSELEKLYLKGCVVRYKGSAIGTANGEVNSIVIPKEFYYDYSDAKYFKGSSAEPVVKSVHALYLVMTCTDDSGKWPQDADNYIKNAVAFPDPVVED